jgi:subtilisin family serine protease
MTTRVRVEQAAAIRTMQLAIPEATVRWRYHLVLNGFSVVLPRSQVARLASLPGLTVWPNVTYHALDGPTQIGATQVWGPALATAGQGMKIAIIDDGLDASHPYFNPAGLSYPPGYPKGQVKLATPKVIVQRAFAPPGETWKYANAPFDPVNSDHATHVAGIAAGDHGTKANGATISGVAPGAYLGNYKALTVPTPEFGLDGNSAELAAAIEAAVADGMNVINMSVGEPEVEPSRDLVVRALENATRAGVVAVVAAGNDFDDFGYGSITSPANTPDAIAVAADDAHGTIADFSSAGPTPVSLEMKPDVTAPGSAILSSLPKSQWGTLSGTSMATPQVAGAVAVLKQRHPAWTVAEVKSALVQTGDPVHATGGGEVGAIREGGGQVDLPKADNPLVFAAPTGLSFGQLRPGTSASRAISLTDAGGGAGPWSVTSVVQAGSATLTVPSTVTVPGTLTVNATAGPATGDTYGFVVLTHGADTRRVPFWLGVSAPQLGTERARTLTHPGVYQGTTSGAPSRVVTYRYPTGTDAAFRGPERVYRVHVGTVANLGVVVLSGHVTPRVTFAGSEDRLTGYPGLPVDLNPYRALYGDGVPAAGAVLPAAGDYDLVFDTATPAQAGPFTFRYWVNDTTPPKVQLISAKGGLTYRITDSGSGVDGDSISVRLDGHAAHSIYRKSLLRVTAPKGRHRVALSVADWQETKNMEDVPPVLPNTTTLDTTVTVR